METFDKYSVPWVIAALAVNSLFLVDLVVHIIVYGVKKLFKTNYEYILEAVLQVFGLAAVIGFFCTGIHGRNVTIKMLNLIILFRQLRLIRFFMELRDFKMIISTFERFSTPFAVVLCSLYTVCFEFAIVGQYLYGGRITTLTVETNEIDAPYMYYLMNFNDFYASMVTLFHVLVINNWNNTTDMYCTVMDHNWPRLYFGLFWVICVLIMLNIVISYVLEMYSVVTDEIEVSTNKNNMVHKLINSFDSEDQLDVFVHAFFDE